MPNKPMIANSPEEAVDRLVSLYIEASEAQRAALARFAGGGPPPDPDERCRFRYPELRLTCEPGLPIPVTRRAWGKIQAPGVYATTVTQPDWFRPYLLEQLRPLVAEYGAIIEVGISDQEMPYPYVLDRGDELAQCELRPPNWLDISRRRCCPQWATRWRTGFGTSWMDEPRPLALFDAVRVDYSLRPPAALYRHRLARHPALDPADQLPALCRPVRALGPR